MKKTDSKLIDSSVWLAYLFNGEYKDIIESNEVLMLSSLSLFEIKKKLAKSKIDSGKIARSMDFIKKKSLVVPVNEEIAEAAVDISLNNNLPLVDSMIYAAAMLNNSTLVTLDNDFRGLKNTTLL